MFLQGLQQQGGRDNVWYADSPRCDGTTESGLAIATRWRHSRFPQHEPVRRSTLFGDVFLLERDGSAAVRAERLAFGETNGRNEAWLRDTLFTHPDLLPLRDIDRSFGPLIPLCKELRTGAGRLDIAFINAAGRLTFVECKLWRNPEARRKVVAQALDYARAISRWSYSDLQRQVAAATDRQGNVPFELAKEHDPSLTEHQFVDDTARAMREGRFLLIIAGDGIREDVSGIAELINRNATSAFSFALVEVALYGFDDGTLAIQPRVVTRTQLIERTVVVVQPIQAGDPAVLEEIDRELSDSEDPSGPNARNELGEGTKAAEYRAWWTPILSADFDDPDQEPPKLFFPNNVRAALPWPKTWVAAYRYGGAAGGAGVYLSGSDPSYPELISLLGSEHESIVAELPPGTQFKKFKTNDNFSFMTHRKASEFKDDDEMRAWLRSAMNAYVNVFRPKLKALIQQQHSQQP
jgi:hypothetical protein